MKLNFYTKSKLNQIKTDTYILVMTEEFVKKSKCNKKCECPLCKARKNDDFKGKSGEMSLIPFENKMTLLCGIGKEKKLTELVAQNFGGTLFSYLNSHKIKQAFLMIDSDIDDKGTIKYKTKIGNNDIYELCANVAFGMRLKSYSFNKYYTGERVKSHTLKVKEVNLLCKKSNVAEERFRELELIAENVFFTRDLISEPANELNPDSYADICRKLIPLGIEVEVLGEKQMEKLGMGSLLAVGLGSDRESKLVTLKWNGAKNKKSTPISFVGKGITFDSGGLSLKPPSGMEEMKTDMGGSAVVVGLIRLLAMRKAKVNAVGVVALVENMVSGKAQKPGDVVKSMSGQTIEVLNTDAEGRLILADAIYYTVTKFKPKMVIDLATLTGAIMVALADKKAGMFSNNESLVRELENSAKKTGEAVWRMPLSELGGEYDKMIDSQIADMKNIGGRYGGSTTAAQLLQRFTNKHKKWCHLDIAGVAWKGKGDSLAKKGATGYGIRLLNKLVKDYYEEK
ncbi:leucyl aminopeptidase [Pseudomonadota bacterium]